MESSLDLCKKGTGKVGKYSSRGFEFHQKKSYKE